MIAEASEAYEHEKLVWTKSIKGKLIGNFKQFTPKNQYIK